MSDKIYKTGLGFTECIETLIYLDPKTDCPVAKCIETNGICNIKSEKAEDAECDCPTKSEYVNEKGCEGKEIYL